MSKSLEVLERMSGASGYYRLYGNDYDTIKQDLEELIILKDKIIELEKENQKLKKDYNLLDTTMESDDRIICELLKENEKLKKAIEILSNYICVRNPLDEEDTYYLSALFSNEEIDKQTHDLLKEVLE